MSIIPPFRRRPYHALAASAILLAFGPTLPADEPQPVVLPEQTASVLEPATTDPFDESRFMPPSASHLFISAPPRTVVPLLFLPPAPPPLDTPVPLRSPLDTGVSPPSELAAHVYDLFYPQLASQLAEDELPRRLRLRLDAYREAKRELQAELHSALAAARLAAPDTRLRLLADCAQLQAARLEALEASADQLRTDLVRPGARFSFGGTPAPTAATGKGVDFRSLQVIAYQVDGLSNDQRRLLLSIANEREAFSAASAPAPLLFFTPEGVSLHLPNSTSPELGAQLAAYTEARKAIARDLVVTLSQTDPDDSRKLRQFAASQAPAFAALAIRAEKLRDALRAEPGVDGLPPVQPLPAALSARLGAYRDHKQALLRQLNATLTQTVRDAGTATAGGIAVPVTAFTEEQQAEIDRLNREKSELRLALAEYHRTNGTTAERKSVDNLLEDFERARQEQELREQYTDYRTAIFEPGLSAAQRRLLLDAALQGLALPLPSGKPMHRP